MNKLLTIFTMLMVASTIAAEVSEAAAQEQEPKEGEVREAVLNGKRVTMTREGGEWVVDTGVNKDRSWTNNVVVTHKPTDEFLNYNGEKLTWAQIDEHTELLMTISPLSLSPQATADDVERVKVATRAQYAMKIGEMYVRNAILAQKARAIGLTIEPAELYTALSNSVKRVPRRHIDKFFSTILKPDSYFYRNQENYLLTRKYRNAVLSGPVEITAEAVAKAIAERDEERREAIEKNAALRPMMQKWLDEIRSGARDFAETAEIESDSSETETDGTMGDFDREEGKDSLTGDIYAFAFAPGTNMVSDVMETPTEYHIIKILSRKYEEAEDDDSIAPAEDGTKAPTWVSLAAIVKEKFEVPEVLTEDGAREVVRKQLLTERFAAAQKAAYKEGKITSVYPIRIVWEKKPRFGKGKEANK